MNLEESMLTEGNYVTCTVPRSALPCHSGRLVQISHYLEIKVIAAYGSKDVTVGSTIPVYPCYTDSGNLHPSAPPINTILLGPVRAEVVTASSAPIATVEMVAAFDDYWASPGLPAVYKAEPVSLQATGKVLY